MSERENLKPAESVTPLGVVKVVVALFIVVGAVLAILGVFGFFAWLLLWKLLLKLGLVAGIIVAAIVLLGWLMRVSHDDQQ